MQVEAAMSIELDGRVGPDGVLELRVPLGESAANTEGHIQIDAAKPRIATQEEWKAFVQRVAGSIDDETFERQLQGE
jgi:hypothetical protein